MKTICYEQEFRGNDEDDVCTAELSIYPRDLTPELEFSDNHGNSCRFRGLDVIKSEVTDHDGSGFVTVWLNSEFNHDGTFYQVPIEFFHLVLTDIESALK